MAGAAWPPLAILTIALAADAWVFFDARARRAEGRNVIAAIGPIRLATPERWLVGCLLLWVFVLPLYLVARRA